MENQVMHKKEELKLAIEDVRRELDISIEAGDYQQTYEKSKKLDKLIEEYIDMDTDCD